MLVGLQAAAQRNRYPLSEEKLSTLGQLLFLFSIIGVLKQAIFGYSLPSLFYLFLFPFIAFEWALDTFVVTSS